MTLTRQQLIWFIPVVLVVAVVLLVLLPSISEPVIVNDPVTITETKKETVINESTTELIVRGNSMAPTLVAGDTVQLQTKTDKELQRGDLVAVKFNTRERKMLKRVVALPGDKVIFRDGQLELNGELLATNWWLADKRLAKRNFKILDIQLRRYNNTVPNNNLIVMGDNASVSYDSGDYGLISMSQLAGRVQVAALQ